MTEREIKYQMSYELADGIHTDHQCKCGRNATRRGRCIVCLAEDLVELHAGRHQKGDKK